jgi:hypothetical protein
MTVPALARFCPSRAILRPARSREPRARRPKSRHVREMWRRRNHVDCLASQSVCTRTPERVPGNKEATP